MAANYWNEHTEQDEAMLEDLTFDTLIWAASLLRMRNELSAADVLLNHVPAEKVRQSMLVN